jgi:hypothetical protein
MVSAENELALDLGDSQISDQISQTTHLMGDRYPSVALAEGLQNAL